MHNMLRFLNAIDAHMKLLNRLTTSYDIDDFHWLEFSYMAEEKLRYIDMNTILYEMDASKP